MSATTTLEFDGAKITVDTSALFRAWFERHLGKPGTPSCAIPAARPGERYLGSITEPSGRMRHTFLLPDDKKKNWNDGMEWARSVGGDLPNRIEQAMLFAYMPDEFQKEAYWSNTQHAGFSHNAWSQLFNNGNQNYISKRWEPRLRPGASEYSASVI